MAVPGLKGCRHCGLEVVDALDLLLGVGEVVGGLRPAVQARVRGCSRADRREGVGSAVDQVREDWPALAVAEFDGAAVDGVQDQERGQVEQTGCAVRLQANNEGLRVSPVAGRA